MKLMEERARVPLFLTYRAVGSGTGQKEFVGNAASSTLAMRKSNAFYSFFYSFFYSCLTRQLHELLFVSSGVQPLLPWTRYKSYSNFGAGDIPMSSTHFQTMTSQTPPESMVPQLIVSEGTDP